MATPRFAGFYVPGSVNISIGSPLGPGGAAVVIPNLPLGVSFPFNVTGRATDEFVSGSQTVDTAAMLVGADGEAVVTLSADKSGMITVTLMASSIVNIALTLAHKAMSNPLAPLLFTFPVSVVDPNSLATVFEGNNCVIQRAPDFAFSGTERTNAWVFLTPEYAAAHGARIF